VVVSAYRSAVAALVRRNLVGAVRNPALSIQPIVGPLVFLLAFGGGLSAFGNIPGFAFPSGYLSFQFVFILMQAGVFNGVFLGLTLARDLELGFATRLLLAIEHRSAIITGYVLAALIRSAVLTALLFGVGLAAQMNVDGSPLHVAGLFAIAITTSALGALWAVGIALRFRTVQAAPMMFMPSFLALFLTPLLVPSHLLAGWIKAVARVNPLTYFLESGRGFISGVPDHTLLAFALLGAMGVLLTLWAARGLRRATAGA
jgi:ABC-2 type transport system permease protein